jgi:hypothetical protein
MGFARLNPSYGLRAALLLFVELAYDLLLDSVIYFSTEDAASHLN